jgi:hypothetical protein
LYYPVNNRTGLAKLLIARIKTIFSADSKINLIVVKKTEK